jgi:fatty-acyl-CoA synthase
VAHRIARIWTGAGDEDAAGADLCEQDRLHGQAMTSASRTPAQCWASALGNIAKLQGDSFRTLADVIDEQADVAGAQPALVAPGDVLTYRGLRDRKNQYAQWATGQGLGDGSTVCLLMDNRPDYVAAWLGIGQAGAVVALLNTGLAGDSLAHAIKASGAMCIVAGAEHADRVLAIRALLPADMAFWIAGPDAAPAWARALQPEAYTAEPADKAACPAAAPGRTALLIYTSGTTGLPKAARISHYRIMEWSFWFAGMMGTGTQDRLYNCLPLYHSTGGVVGIGAMLVSGGSVELRKRFSASMFWADVAKTQCTLFLYIGELCRYLLAAQAGGHDQAHSLRLCVGNGLRGDIWQAFVDRFAIPQVLEFYASTEGNVSLYNCEGRPGAIGRVPPLLAQRFPVALIECDAETGEPRRGPDGRCIRCAPGVPGEALGQIRAASGADPTSFDGYTDAAATERKILRGVFKDGDAWFRTGDLMMQDRDRFFYFVDRLGDTFRWKGENVSTLQVAEALCRCPGVNGAVVYGVAVAGTDGRAGMAALTVSDDFSMPQLEAAARVNLPAYARPMFVRIRHALENTGTFKPVKTALVRDGFNTTVVADPIYVYDPRAGTYGRLTASESRRLMGMTDRAAAQQPQAASA